MKKFQLSKTQLRNLDAAQDDMDIIDLEIEKARKAGIPISNDLIEICTECRDRIGRIRQMYVDSLTERKVIPDESP